MRLRHTQRLADRLAHHRLLVGNACLADLSVAVFTDTAEHFRLDLHLVLDMAHAHQCGVQRTAAVIHHKDGAVKLFFVLFFVVPHAKRRRVGRLAAQLHTRDDILKSHADVAQGAACVNGADALEPALGSADDQEPDLVLAQLFECVFKHRTQEKGRNKLRRVLVAVVALAQHLGIHLFIEQHFEAAKTDDTLFSEPFSGGGSVKVFVFVLVVAHNRRIVKHQMTRLHRSRLAVF